MKYFLNTTFFPSSYVLFLSREFQYKYPYNSFPTCVELDIIPSLFFDTDIDITSLYILRMRAADIGNMMND
jgi:hypothetical protein